jgi:hypothetical protein
MLWQAGRQQGIPYLSGRCLIDRLNESEPMNQIIYIVGLIVIVVFVLGYFGLR